MTAKDLNHKIGLFYNFLNYADRLSCYQSKAVL